MTFEPTIRCVGCSALIAHDKGCRFTPSIVNQKSEGWSVSQKEAIREQLREFAGRLVGIGVAYNQGLIDSERTESDSMKIVDEIIAITKGTEQ